MTMDGARQSALTLPLLASTQFVLILDAAIVGVAMPSMAADLGFAPADLSWVANAYTLLFGGFLLLGGRVGDVVGATPSDEGAARERARRGMIPRRTCSRR
ncbi:MAG: hypothetical protein H0U86_00925 [Chloroflexi bacterium]|nr:hypothetical protein [Chloroflexota bacterium]